MPLQKNIQLIDTNVILRFILNDNSEMAQRASEVIASGAYTKPEIIAEVVYVLKSVYSMPKEKIKSVIHGLSKSEQELLDTYKKRKNQICHSWIIRHYSD